MALTILLCSGRPQFHLPRRWPSEPRCCDTCPPGLLRWSCPRLVQRRGLQLLHQRLPVSDVWSVIHCLWILQFSYITFGYCNECIFYLSVLNYHSLTTFYYLPPVSEQSGDFISLIILGCALILPCVALISGPSAPLLRRPPAISSPTRRVWGRCKLQLVKSINVLF